MLNTLDTFPHSDDFTIVVETDNLSAACPSMLAKAGILVMRSLLIPRTVPHNTPSCGLQLPSVPFSAALKSCSDVIDSTNVAVVRRVFNAIAPVIVARAFHAKNSVCYIDNPERIPGGFVILGGVLPRYAALLTMQTLADEQINQSNEEQVRVCMVQSFARVFDGVLESSEIVNFEAWLRLYFNVVVPEDWAGFNVSDSFVAVYPKPSLLAMRMYSGALIPLNLSQLNEKPIVTTPPDSQFLYDDLAVCHAQILSALLVCEKYLSAKQNFLIHGSSDSGKSSFLNVLFDGKEQLVAIVISVSDALTVEHVIGFLTTHTPSVSKSTSFGQNPKSCVLVFDGICAHHTELLEFIRMLITLHSYPVNSPNNQKVWEIVQFQATCIIVTTHEYPALPSRFSSHFAPVGLESISASTALFIGGKVLDHCGYPDDLSHRILKFVSAALAQFPGKSLPRATLRFFSTFGFLTNKENTKAVFSSCFLEVFAAALHRYPVNALAEGLPSAVSDVLGDPESQALLTEFLAFENLYCPSVECLKDDNRYSAVIEPHPRAKLIEELRHYLQIYNSNAIEKIVLKFSAPILRQWSLIYRVIAFPGENVVLHGQTGSGRFSLTRLVASICECDFIGIPEPLPEDLLAPDDRRTALALIIREVVTNTAAQQKNTVLFMRATKQNRTEVMIVSSFGSNLDILPFFTPAALDDLYNKMRCNASGSEQRAAALFQVKRLVRLHLHVVIALEENAGYSLTPSGFDEVQFDVNATDFFLSVSADSLRAFEATIGPLPASLAELFASIGDLAKSLIPKFHTNMFYDFLDSFSKYLTVESTAMSVKHNHVQRATALLAGLKQEGTAVSQRIATLSPTLQQLELDSESMELSYATRKEAIEIRRVKLHESYESYVAEAAALAEEVKALENERVVLIPRRAQFARDVEKLTDNDIETIRITAADPLPSLRLLLEVFCIFLDLPASYERSGQKLLMDPHFVSMLITRVTNCPITANLLATLAPYFENPVMDPLELEAIAPALKTLFDWVESLTRLTVLTESLAVKKKQLEEKRRNVSDFVEEMNLELSSISEVEESLILEAEAIAESRAASTKLEAEFRDVEARKKSLDAIFRNIDPLLAKWSEETQTFEVRRHRLFGDSITFSFYLVFCGIFPSDDRASVMTKVRELIIGAGFDATAEDPLRFLFINPDENCTDVLSAQVDARHVRMALRVPLLVDPDGIVTAAITNSIKPKRLLVVSQNCAHLETIVASAVSEGKTLVLLDADELHPIVSSVMPLSLAHRDENTSVELRIGSKLVTWDVKFKLILVSMANGIDGIPDALLARVTLVNVASSSLAATQALLVRTFIEFFDPAIAPRYVEMQSQEIAKRVLMDRSEQQMLEILVDIVATRITKPDYDCLADEEIVGHLVTAKDAYVAAKAAPESNPKLAAQVKAILKPLERHVKLCSTFWRVLSREMSRLNSSCNFVFANYQKAVATVFVNDGLHPGPLTADQHTALKHSLTASTFQFVLQSLPVRDGLFFMFLAGLELRKVAKKSHTNLKTELLEHVREEVFQSYDFEASDVATGDPLDHLSFTNIVHVFLFFNYFLIQQYGIDYSSFFPHFTIDSVIPNSASIPSIVIANPKANPTSLIQHFIGMRCRHENLDSISLSDDVELIKNARKIISLAMNRGNWVILHYTKPSAYAASMLTDIFTQMTTTSLNTNFRLIIIASSTDCLPKSMIAKSKRVNVEAFPNVRNVMLQLFHHHSVSIRSTANSKGMKKLAYSCALLISLIGFRRALEPVGFCGDCRPNDLIFRDLIDQLQLIIDTNPNDIALKNLGSQIERVVYAGVADSLDRRRISAHISAVLVSDCLEDGFSILAPSESSEKWAIPGDIPLSSFTQIIQQLPLFPTTDVMRMDAASLRSWNLSTWIAGAFLKYEAHTPPVDWTSLQSKVGSILAMIPRDIDIPDSAPFSKAMGLFILSEVATLNRVLVFLRSELLRLQNLCAERQIDYVLLQLSKSAFPLSWRAPTSIWTMRRLGSFTSHIIERHAQLVRCVQEGRPIVFDMRLIADPRFLLQAFLTDAAVELKIPFETARYEFTVSDGLANIEPNCIFLTRTTLMCGDISAGRIGPKADGKCPLKPIPAITANVVTELRGNASTYYGLPMLHHGLVGDHGYVPTNEGGDSANFVWNIAMMAEAAEDVMDQAGSTIFCQIPDQFA
jgi:hypothetical protein